jgi:hypothetical protein
MARVRSAGTRRVLAPYCRRRGFGLSDAMLRLKGAWWFMPDSVIVPPRFPRLLLVTAAVAAGVLLAAALALWVHYGTAVFYEMILAGIGACF